MIKTLPTVARTRVPTLPSPENHSVTFSTGVGRQGYFIALDYLLDQAVAENGVDVFQCVKALQTNRPLMMQSLVRHNKQLNGSWGLDIPRKKKQVSVPYTSTPVNVDNVGASLHENHLLFNAKCGPFLGAVYLLTRHPGRCLSLGRHHFVHGHFPRRLQHLAANVFTGSKDDHVS